MNTLHAIIVRYVQPTNTRPGRVSLTSGRHYAGRRGRVIVTPWDYAAGNSIEEQAAKWLTDHGFTVLYRAEINARESVVLVREFCGLDEDPAEWRENNG